tara:strand:+ start:1410 stop:1529 length:120 start_codon:yes stop_codon:yes gene_type:complete
MQTEKVRTAFGGGGVTDGYNQIKTLACEFIRLWRTDQGE